MKMAKKIEQLILSATAFFWCFLMWFSTAAFSPTIITDYNLSTFDWVILASSPLWLAPPGRILAGWAVDKIGARDSYVIILVVTGVFSIASAFVQDYLLLFVTRIIVSTAGVSFVVGIQHVSQWFEDEEMGTAEGLYAGTGNAGAGVGALLLPRIYESDYSSAFLHLGIIALFIALIILWRVKNAKTKEREEAAKKTATLRDTLFVWSRWPAIALMFAYAMSFGLEIAMNGYLPGYYKSTFSEQLAVLGFVSDVDLQIAVGTFAAVQSLNASLFRPFSGYMSDLWQRKRWMPYPMVGKNLPYSPRIHWLMTALICITLLMILLSIAGIFGLLHMSVIVLAIFGVCVSFGTGATFAIVPLMFKNRPGTAAGFIGGISTLFSIPLAILFAWDALPSLHYGFAFVSIAIFIPTMLFFILAIRIDFNPEDHGIGSKELWLGQQ
ncbi:MAG: putative nitrate transporter NarT [Candidatus Heimdallarchaeota archaeon LC_3]|nr:MAG: putative nitrate transporter NarT [Candidatus Heimdallarchaeota archaeon LC_3]